MKWPRATVVMTPSRLTRLPMVFGSGNRLARCPLQLRRIGLGLVVRLGEVENHLDPAPQRVAVSGARGQIGVRDRPDTSPVLISSTRR